MLHDFKRAQIGLEVHAQLKLNSKLFSQGSAEPSAPNTSLDVFDICMPGTLPKLNQEAIRLAVMTGLALNCNIQSEIHFDRKNYFYSDMPAGYQITQYAKPIATDGHLDFITRSYQHTTVQFNQSYDMHRHVFPDSHQDEQLDSFSPYIKKSQIKQIQLEQDSAKTLHADDANFDLVDYGRSGIALIEIVFEPDLSNEHEATALVKELVALLRDIGTCECELQEGGLRVDANVSIVGYERVELKNLNSLRALNHGIRHEIIRQSALIDSGGRVLRETRSYDSKTNETKLLRHKEDTVDYRYVPEPNIPPLMIDVVPASVVAKPLISRNELIELYNIDLIQVSNLCDEPGLASYYHSIMQELPKERANYVADYLTYVYVKLKNSPALPAEVSLREGSKFLDRLPAHKMREIISMVMDEHISADTGYEVVKYQSTNDDSAEPRAIVENFGWMQENDAALIRSRCAQVISRMKVTTKRYRKLGKPTLLHMIVLRVLDEDKAQRFNLRLVVESINDIIKPNLAGATGDGDNKESAQ